MLRAIPVVMVVSLLCLPGCESYPDTFYEPRPARLEAPLPRADDTQRVRALATITGVRRQADVAQHVVDVRLRVENNTATPVTFDPRTLSLMDGRLQEFGEPIIAPPAGDGPMNLGPGDAVRVDASFPFPPDVPANRVDLDSLSLRWTVRAGEDTLAYSALFRREQPYYDHYPYYRYGWGYHPYWSPHYYRDRYWWGHPYW